MVFTLYADGTATSYTVTLDGTAGTAPAGTGGYENPAWTATFINLPKYKIVNDAAVEIVYTVKETTTYPGYTASPTDPVASGETITNTQESTTPPKSPPRLWTSRWPLSSRMTTTLPSCGPKL